MKRFRSDNGKAEYENSLFWELLASKGIVFQPSPPYRQHKNGASERMIETLNSCARLMLIDANVLITFWAEVVSTAVYLHHRSPSSALEGKSPLKVLRLAEPILIAHLRRFSRVAYYRIPNDTRSASLIKFTPRSRLCMMIGYSELAKIWRLWDFLGNSGHGWPIYSSDIIFVEQENAINWQPDHEQTPQAGWLSPVYFAPVHPHTNELPVSTQAEIDIFLPAIVPAMVDEPIETVTQPETLPASVEIPPMEPGGWIYYLHS